MSREAENSLCDGFVGSWPSGALCYLCELARTSYKLVLPCYTLSKPSEGWVARNLTGGP